MKCWTALVSVACFGFLGERILGARVGAADEVAKANSAGFFFIQISDPQIGMQNGYAKTVEGALNWEEELRMLQEAAAHIMRLKPSFVVLTGDMQQFWPKNDVVGDEGSATERNSALGPSSNQGDVGDKQAEDVRTVVEEIITAQIPVKTLPGNHDLDDAPTDETLERYRKLWGKDHYSFRVDDVLFLTLNSQLYYDDTELSHPEKTDQTNWLRDEMKEAQSSGVKQIVVLTHIAPYVGFPDEAHGWANWKYEDRAEVLRLTTDPSLYEGEEGFEEEDFKWAQLWVCGHMHGNSRSKVLHGGRSVEVVVTSSVGSVMLWDGKDSNEYTPAEASGIASKPIAEAFGQHIIQKDFSNIGKRVLPDAGKSGLRVVQFLPDGSYRHKWFTLAELNNVQSIDDMSMSGSVTSNDP